MKAKLLTFALASLLLTGCGDEKAMVEKLIPKDEDAQARHFIELVRTGDSDAAQNMLASNLRGEKTSLTLLFVHNRWFHEEPLEIEPVGCNISSVLLSSQRTQRDSLTYQIHFKDSWVVGNLIFDHTSAGTQIVGFHFTQEPDSLENFNRFTLRGKAPHYYAVLAFCVLIPAFILYALIVCIRTPLRRKWLWIVFIIFGLMKFRFDWSTGVSDVQPLSIVLFGAGAFSSSYCGPWILDWSLPVGALVFLVRRRKLMQQKPPVRRTGV